MEKLIPIAKQLSRARWLPPVVILLTLAVLGSMIALGTRQLRDSIRTQIIHRDAEVLDAVATLEQMGAVSAGALAQQLEDTGGQLGLALRLSRLRDGVLATRLFDAQGRFVTALPVLVRKRNLAGEDLAAAIRLQPVTRYEPAARLEDDFLVVPSATPEAAARVPLLSVLIPIHAQGQTNLLAVAEIIQDGRAIAREFATLDRNLARQATLAFLGSGFIVALALGWAFGRLQNITRQLHEHAADLRRANQELSLAAKTSALGAVTAHVLHGLTSPLAGLQNFMFTHAGEDAEWQDALRGTERMQSLIGEIVRVLGEETGGTHYELPLAELLEIISDKVRPSAQAAGIVFESRLDGGGQLSNRNASLVLLILENLLRNAIQATPRGKAVRLVLVSSRAGLRCEVEDEGSGLPEAVQQNLFLPTRSTKPGGNGIGLALSQHLARHLGAELKLVCSTASGCIFDLSLPRELLVNGAPTLSASKQPALLQN